MYKGQTVFLQPTDHRERHEEAEERVVRRVRQGRDHVPDGRQRVRPRGYPEVRGEEQAGDQAGREREL
jgi:hypothetical protein